MPVLFEEISNDLGLSLVQIGTIWGMVGLPGLFTAFAAGLIGDRYGTRLTLGATCLLSGIAGALRGLSGGFTSLAIYMFLFGLSAVPIALTTHKAAGEWFPERQLGLANGILAMGMGFGTTMGAMISATVLAPLLGGWRNLLFVYGAIAIVISLLWFQTRRNPGQVEVSYATGTAPFRQALSHVVRIRLVWFLALVQTFLGGCKIGVTGYLPLYLRRIGWTDVGADGALSALSAASVVGVIPMSMLSDKIGLRKVIIYPAILATVIGVGALSIFGGAAVWPLVVIIGIVQEGLSAVFITMIMETEGVRAAYAGTALGLCTTFGGLSGFFSPPIGNRLAEINSRFAFIFWSALALVSLLVFRFVKETGWRKREIHPDTEDYPNASRKM
jgi:MFS family permease